MLAEAVVELVNLVSTFRWHLQEACRASFLGNIGAELDAAKLTESLERSLNELIETRVQVWDN